MVRRLRLLESLLALWLAWVLVFALPFRFAARLLALEPPSDAPNLVAEATLARARSVVRHLRQAERWFPFHVTCLVRAIAGWLLLARRGIESTVRFGVRRESGKFEAHAWLLTGKEALVGGEVTDRFTPLADLGSGNSIHSEKPFRAQI